MSVPNSGRLRAASRNGFHILREKRDVFSGAIFEHKRETARCADTRDSGRRKSESNPFAQTGKVFVQPRLNGGILLLRFRSFAPRLECDKEKGVVSVVNQAEQTEPNDAGGGLHPGRLLQKIFNLLTNLVGSLKRRRVG